MIDFSNTIDFMSKRKFATALSAILIIISIGSFFVNGMRFGLDFTGGTQAELLYEESPDLEDIRNTLAQNGFQN